MVPRVDIDAVLYELDQRRHQAALGRLAYRSTTGSGGSEMTSPKEVLNKMVEVWNAHDRAGWMTICSPDVMMHRHPASLEGWRADYDLLQDAFPDNRIEVTSSAEEADLVYFEMSLTGTHTGALPPWQPTGKSVKLDFGGIARVVDGKMVSLTAYGIMEGLTQHLGVTPELAAVT